MSGDTSAARTRESTARLFVALSFADAVRRSVWDQTRSLREADLPVRWVRAEQLHITLRFLGSVEIPRIAAVRDALDRAAAGARPFRLVLRDVGAFPSPARARVVWVGVEPEPALTDLHGRLEAALEEIGFEPEKRPFHAHVTLGRARPPRGLARGALEEASRAASVHEAAEITHLHLMRSRLSSAGARYSVEAASPLGGRGRAPPDEGPARAVRPPAT